MGLPALLLFEGNTVESRAASSPACFARISAAREWAELVISAKRPRHLRAKPILASGQ